MTGSALTCKGAPISNNGPTRSEIVSLLDRYCFECHGEGTRKGKFDLEELLKPGKSEEKGAQWLKTWKTMRHGFMPPPEADALPGEARAEIARWVAQEQLGVDFREPDPGRVTMRRLNRIEYECTVTDLFETDFSDDGRFRPDVSTTTARLREMLPPDDTAFGFDNIGDFQTLSPALLEKYFNLAEFVVDRAILVNGPRPRERQLPLSGVSVQKDPASREATHRLAVPIDKPGRFRVAMQFRIGGWHESRGAYEVELSSGSHLLGKQVVETGGEKTYTFTGTAELNAGKAAVTFTTRPVAGGPTERQAPLALQPKLWLIGPLDSDLVYPHSHQRVFFRGEPPPNPAERRIYAREIMKRMADRAFRRPAPESMLDRLTSLVLNAPSFEAGVAQGLMAILISPKFLFRTECQPQPDDPKAIHPLDEFALASRLSYFLWLSLPDAELHDLAARGAVPANLRTQVKRMLDDPKATRFFEDFTGQWLRTRNVLMTPISRVDDEINSLRAHMKRETDILFEDIARNDRDLIELITANYSFVNAELAKYYGIPGEGDAFQRVELPVNSRRGGILTHASFLISTSNPNRTSPVKRGLFVLENLLGIEPPPPPPGVAALDDAKSHGETPPSVREQLAAHRAEKSCAACHAYFDPIGVALENYDLIARWRTSENGQPISPDEKTVSGERLAGVDDLKKYFTANKAQFYRCVSEKLLTYALGRGLEPSDSVITDAMSQQLLANGGKFSELLMAVVESRPFQMRRGDDGAQKSSRGIVIPATPSPELRKGRKRRFNNQPVEAATRPEAEVTTPTANKQVP